MGISDYSNATKGASTLIFIKNKYHKTYFNIIDKAIQANRTKSKDQYYENHHIFPRALYPKLIKNKLNLVLLTAKEHFICHICIFHHYNEIQYNMGSEKNGMGLKLYEQF